MMGSRMKMGYGMLKVTGIIMIMIITVAAIDKELDMDRLSTCRQDVIIKDFTVILKGRANAAPANPPTECIVYLQSGFTDGQNRLQIEIIDVDIEDCAVFVDIFDGRGAYGQYLRRLGCSSKSKDSLFSKEEWVTIRFKRPIILYQTAYNFQLNIKTYEDPDFPGILLGGTRLSPAAIIGMVVGLLVIIVLLIILCWCWRSGRIYDYIGWMPKDDEKETSNGDDGQENKGVEKSETGSIKSGFDHRDPLVWNTLTSGSNSNLHHRQDGGQQYIGRRMYRQRTSDNPNSDQNGVVGVVKNANGETAVGWQKEQTNLKQSLNSEIRQGSRNLRQSNNGRKETLVDDVFESDDNQVNDKNRRLLSHGGDNAYDKVETPQYLKQNRRSFEYGEGDNRGSGRSKGDEPSTRDSRRRGDGSPSRGSRRQGESPNRGSDREDESPTRGSLRRKQGDSPIRGSLRRDEEGRDSKRSVGSNKEGKMTAQTLAAEALGAKLKSRSGDARKQEDLDLNQVDPPSDFDSSSFMSVPEPAVITASIHNPNKQPSTTRDSQRNKDRDSSEDSELREINNRAEQEQPNTGNGSKKSPKNKKKKKSKDQENRVPEDVLPPEAFEPLFDRPVSEDPLPSGMQPLNAGFNPYGGMYPIPGYGMPYGMMPPPGTVPPGTQTYAYAYQSMPGPGMAPQQVAGKAAYFVQETPTKHGPVQKTAFMMATQESRPQSQDGPHNDLQTPGNPGYTSTPYGSSPRRTGSGPRGGNKPMSIVPGGAVPRDNGQGHRSAMMKSGVDPNTGIETNQVLWTDTTRDPTDPPPGANPQITRKTITRTTTRSGYADLPENTDEITDYLYLQSEPNEPAFMTPSRGAQMISATETPDRDNVSYYMGLQHRHGHPASPQHVIHPAPSRHKAIKDSISLA